jgi:sugar phosphate permease
VSTEELSRAAPDRRRFAILAVVWVSYLMVYLARLSVGPLSPFLKDAFRLSNTQVGTLISATALTYAPTLIVAGWLVDRLGVRRMLVAGTLIASGCVSLLFFANSYPRLLVLLGLSSFGSGCIYPSAVKAVMLWFPVRERATAIGANQTAINVSGIIGAVTLPALASGLGWQYGFLAIGLVGLAIAAVCIVGYRDPPAARIAPDDLAASRADGAVAPSARRLLASGDVWLLGSAGLFLGVVEYSTLAHLVLYLNRQYLFTAVAAGGLLALCQASGAVAKPLSGLVSDRLLGGRRRPALLALATVTLVSCLVLAAGGGRLAWGLYIVIALLGFAAVGWGGLFGTVAGEIGGHEAAGQVAGFTAAGVNVGIVFGPPAFGAVVDSSGSYGLAWLLMAAASIAAIVCLALLKEPRAETPGAAIPALADA